MFDRLKELFGRAPTTAAPLPEPDARLALGTLMVRVAMADRAYLFEEVEQIDRLLAEAYDLGPIEAAKMRAICERLALELPADTDLAALVSEDHKLDKARALWKIALADGAADERETELVEMIETELGISAEDQAALRQEATGQ